MKDLYIIGAGGFGREVAWLIERINEVTPTWNLKGLIDGSLTPQKQNEEEATYLLIRRPEDGLIDWKDPIEKVHRLVRAVSHPYPGAFGMYDGVHRIVIWRAEIIENKSIIGIPGQICRIGTESFDGLGSDGILRVTDWDNIDQVKMFVGHKLK